MTIVKVIPGQLTEAQCPELHALKGVLQNPIWHPEGDAYIHTLLVFEAAVEIAKRDNLNELDTSVLLLAALCHDFGKATHSFFSVQKNTWTSPGHDLAGEIPTRNFLNRLNVKEEIQERIVCLVREHMCHTYLKADVKPSKKAAVGLLSRIEGKTTLDELQRLVEADVSGRPPLKKHCPQTYLLLAATCREVLEEKRLLSLEPKPLLTGKEVMDLGIQQGPKVGEALLVIASLQANGIISTKEKAIDYIIRFIKHIESNVY